MSALLHPRDHVEEADLRITPRDPRREIHAQPPRNTGRQSGNYDAVVLSLIQFDIDSQEWVPITDSSRADPDAQLL